MVICNWELAEARKRDALDRARVRGEEPPSEVLAEERGLHSSIEADVKNLLEGKKFRDLEAMQQQIESQMRSGTAKERKREAVVIEQQRRIQEAIAAKTITPEDNMELKAMKAMGAMEEGDAVFGVGAEVTLDSQAFRIVNKEWEYSHKKGFKCTFERGILHLYFNFKRYRYRR
ncbi:hypothetical protein B296_00019613 [Ensete ventricosum]|uniref:Splicing factor Cactin n=1 Tax=Ensete ventricosum TaxID=4639 RepID=A0A427B2F1_ENSVE|nr:hypothetical protein B296_00019613 [Ensete ventricosum]